MANSDIFSLGTMIERMRQHEAKVGRLPDKAFATKEYMKALVRGAEDTTPLIKDENANPADGAMMEMLGMPFYLSSLLPKGVRCIFMDKNNQPLGMIVDETYKRHDPSKKSPTA
jgi:hypothetical protein